MELCKTGCNDCGLVHSWQAFKFCDTKDKKDWNASRSTFCTRCGSRNVRSVEDGETMAPFRAAAALFVTKEKEMTVEERFKLPPLEIRHADLKRHDDSSYRSVSPCCDSVLLLRRNQTTLKLEREDVCIRCGRRYRYTDPGVNGERFDGEEAAS